MEEIANFAKFHMSGKSQTIGDFTFCWFCRPSQILPINQIIATSLETLLILQIFPRPSQTIGDIYDFQFSLVGKIWDSRETVKSPIVWDFPDVWKPGWKILKQLSFLIDPFGLTSRLSRKFHFNRLYIIYIFSSLQTTKLICACMWGDIAPLNQND